MSISDVIAQVEKCLENDQLTEAQAQLDQLRANQQPATYRLLILQAQVFLRRKKCEECKKCASEAVSLGFEGGKRTQISEALKMLSMAYFKNKEFDDAFKYVVYAEKYDDTKNPEINMLKNMVVQKLKTHNGVDEDAIKTREADILAVAFHPAKTNTENKPATSASAPVALKPANPLNAGPVKQNMRYDWFDSGSSVEISIYVKRINSESVKSNITKRAVEFTFVDGDNFTYDFSIENLFGNVIPTECSFKVYGTKLTLLLVKENKEGVWTSLEQGESNQDEKLSSIPKDENVTNISYPTSSNKKTDWSKFHIDDEDGDEDEDDADPEGFFRKLYQGADENTRRAMMKSFVESNGTSLSTDWSDVGSREVKPYEEEKSEK